MIRQTIGCRGNLFSDKPICVLVSNPGMIIPLDFHSSQMGGSTHAMRALRAMPACTARHGMIGVAVVSEKCLPSGKLYNITENG